MSKYNGFSVFLYYLMLFFLGFLVSAFKGYSQNKYVPRGYLLVQSIETNKAPLFNAISSRKHADSVFARLKGKIDGIEFDILEFSEEAIDSHRVIAKVAKEYGIDLWTSTRRILKAEVHTLLDIDVEYYQARRMDSSGSILPAFFDNGKPVFDILDPEAMDTFVSVWKSKYWDRMKDSNGVSLLNGLFFNEDFIPYLDDYPSNNKRWDYWNLAVYSYAVLEQWREYCENYNVEYQGHIVSKFPVHKLEMVENGIVDGAQLTAYFPGYNVPGRIYAGERFIDLPRVEGVWKHWYDFMGELFVNNWIARLAEAANESNENNPDWYGNLYFGHHAWSFPYEYIEDSNFTVPRTHKWSAWGRQRGLDLKKLVENPYIDIVVCETYPPIVKGNLEYFVKEYKRITEEENKVFGLMLHRDDNWALNLSEEIVRWGIINKYKPQMICRSPRRRIIGEWEDSLYSEKMEIFFRSKLEDYRKH